jgi:hypothetical protein
MPRRDDRTPTCLYRLARTQRLSVRSGSDNVEQPMLAAGKSVVNFADANDR